MPPDAVALQWGGENMVVNVLKIKAFHGIPGNAT